MDLAEAALKAGRFPSGHPLAVTAPLWILIENGRLAEATVHLRRYEHISASHADPSQRAGLLTVSALLALYEGRLASANEMLRECLAALDSYGTRHDHPMRMFTVGTLACLLLTGGHDQAAQALLRQHRCLGGLAKRWGTQEVLVARAWLRAQAGDTMSAGRDIDEALRADGCHFWHAWSALGVDVLRQTGRASEARDLARRFLKRAGAASAPDLRAAALHMLGSAVGGREGERLLHQAVRRLRNGSARLELAHTLTSLGELQSSGCGRGEAVATLTEALRMAKRCEAGLLSERVRRRLAVVESATSHHMSLRGVLALTARERQVLAEAVSGQTNENISQKLHVTQRTIELHLSNAYRKLGIKGRREFPAIFEREGLWELLSD